MRHPWLFALLLGLVFPISAAADDKLARFDGGIGVVLPGWAGSRTS
jgi:hypothetical protein